MRDMIRDNRLQSIQVQMPEIAPSDPVQVTVTIDPPSDDDEEPQTAQFKMSALSEEKMPALSQTVAGKLFTAAQMPPDESKEEPKKPAHKPKTHNRGALRVAEGAAESVGAFPEKVYKGTVTWLNGWESKTDHERERRRQKDKLPYMSPAGIAERLMEMNEEDMEKEFVSGDVTLKAHPEKWFEVSKILLKKRDESTTVSADESTHALFLKHASPFIIGYINGKGSGNIEGRAARKLKPRDDTASVRSKAKSGKTGGKADSDTGSRTTTMKDRFNRLTHWPY